MSTQPFQMQLSELLIDTIKIDTKHERLISGLNLDSRLVQSGDLFFAKAGYKTDGALYIKDAIEKGAVAVAIDTEANIQESDFPKIPIIRIPHLAEKIGLIAARFYQFPSQKMQVIGITGTNGKTSCSHFLAQALQQAAVIGTIGNGLLGQLETPLLTTPDAISLQKLLAQFVQQNVRYVAMEVASHALDQHRVAGVDFAVTAFTNLSRDHLDYHQTMENYAHAKQRLFSLPHVGCGVINMDDEYGQQWLPSLYGKLPMYAYTIHRQDKTDLPANLPLIVAREVHYADVGITASVHTPWGKGVLHNPYLMGHFNLSNLLLVLTVLGIFGLPLEEILLRLAKIRGVNGRLEALGGGDKPLVVVDYSHTPDALEKALAVLRDHCQGKLWCVFGCGGDRDRGKRPVMGKIAAQYADHMIITDDNPRTEDPRIIVSEILQGLTEPHLAIVEHDRRRAIAHAISCAQKGDVILIAGKGHETYQIIGEEKQVFSDSLEAQLLLAEKNYD